MGDVVGWERWERMAGEETDMTDWPKNDKYAQIEEICVPLREAFDQIVTLNRGASRKKIKWTGLETREEVTAVG